MSGLARLPSDFLICTRTRPWIHHCRGYDLPCMRMTVSVIQGFAAAVPKMQPSCEDAKGAQAHLWFCRDLQANVTTVCNLQNVRVLASCEQDKRSGDAGPAR